MTTLTMAEGRRSDVSILIINPNSSESMTRGLEPILADLVHPGLTLHYHTGPEHAPPSVNDHTTSVLSAAHTFASLLPLLQDNTEHVQHDAYLVACFSDHPLVGMLREHTSKPVLGIFEASVMHSLALGQPFGIVTTGKYWEGALAEGVRRVFGSVPTFVGVESTGVTALELHALPAEGVAESIAAAAERIVARGARTIVMGCAGMSGMEDAVRRGCGGESVQIVDAVRSGVVTLEGLVRTQRLV